MRWIIACIGFNHRKSTQNNCIYIYIYTVYRYNYIYRIASPNFLISAKCKKLVGDHTRGKNQNYQCIKILYGPSWLHTGLLSYTVNICTYVYRHSYITVHELWPKRIYF